MLGLMRSPSSHFLALAPHSVAALDAVLERLGWQQSGKLFVPVFPIDTGLPPDAETQGFVLQGLLQENRCAPARSGQAVLLCCKMCKCTAQLFQAGLGWRACA